MSSPSMSHWNGSRACVVNAITNGPDPTYHEMIQLTFVLLDNMLDPAKGVKLYFLNLKPECPESADGYHMWKNGKEVQRVTMSGVSPETARIHFYAWYEGLGIQKRSSGETKKLIPIAYDYTTIKPFLIRWLGAEDEYRKFFSHEYRDIIGATSLLNDASSFHAERAPFPHITLGRICSRVGVPKYGVKPNCLRDALTIAKVYKRLCSKVVAF